MKKILTPSEVEDLLRAEPEWSLKDGRLVREWTFRDFPEAMAFVNRIAALAQEANHHPDIDIRYNRVQLALISHDAGGITGRDASMARRITEITPN